MQVNPKFFSVIQFFTRIYLFNTQSLCLFLAHHSHWHWIELWRKNTCYHRALIHGHWSFGVSVRLPENHVNKYKIVNHWTSWMAKLYRSFRQLTILFFSARQMSAVWGSIFIFRTISLQCINVIPLFWDPFPHYPATHTRAHKHVHWHTLFVVGKVLLY